MTDQQHDDQHEPHEDDQRDEAYDEAFDEQPHAGDEAYDAVQEDDWVGDGGGTGPVVGAWEPDTVAGVGPLVAAGVVSVLAVLVLVLAWAAFGPDDDGGGDVSSDTAPAGRVSTVTSPAPSLGTERGRLSRLSRCVRAQGALGETLDAAQPALEQWKVHVGAMNQLVVGEITLQQAKAFWERTRLGAQRRVRDFEKSLGALRARGVDCPGPALLAPGARALPGCAREVHAAVRAVQAARLSVSTWEEHIHHMDMLRLGRMTPEEATELWLSSWERGVRDLDAYESASKAADREDGCSQAGSSR